MSKYIKINFVIIILSLILTACMLEPTNAPDPELIYAIEAAKDNLSQKVGVQEDEIEEVSYERMQWPDACLGLAESGELCAQVITPGWEIVLAAEGQRYVYRTDDTGQLIRLEE